MSTTYQLIVQEPIPVGTYIVTLAPVGPVTPDVPRGTVFANGKLLWIDASWAGALHTADVLTMAIAAKWGGFQVSAPGGSFDTSKYTQFSYKVKPTRAQTFGTSFHAPDGSDNGGLINSGTLSAGVWSTVTIPLAQFKLSTPLVKMFSIGDSSGVGANSYQLDQIQFT